MKQKLPVKVWLISAMLLVITVVHLVMGFTGNGFNWLWIVLCGAMSVIYPILEYKLMLSIQQDQEAAQAEAMNEDEMDESDASEEGDPDYHPDFEEVVDDKLVLEDNQKD